MEHTTTTSESARALSLRGSESGDKWLEPLCGFLPFGGRPVVLRSPGCRTWPRVLRIGHCEIAFDGYFTVGGKLYLGRSRDECALIGAALVQDTRAFLSRVDNGFFNAVIHDHQLRETRFVSDAFGALPLYLARDGRALFFASTYAGLKNILGVDLVPDPVGVAELYWLGHPLGDRTSYRNVRHIPAGSILTVRWRDGTERLERYPRDEACPALPATAEELADHVVALVTAAARRLHRADARYGARLSAGTDSRLVCGLWPDNKVHAYTHGYPASAEMALAARLAQALAMPHTSVPVEGDFFTSLHAPVFDAHGITDFFHPASVPAMHRDGVELVLDGFGGDVVLGGPALKPAAASWRLMPAKARSQYNDEEIADFLLNCVRVPDDSFKPLTREACTALNENWEGVRADMVVQVRQARPRGQSFQQLCAEVLFRNRARRLVSLQGTACRPWVETIYPFLDRELVSLLGRIPEKWVANKRLYVDIYRRHLPALRTTPGALSLLPYSVPSPLHSAGRIARRGMERIGLELSRLTGGRVNPWASDGIQWRRWLVFNERFREGARRFMRPSAVFDDAVYIKTMSRPGRAAQVSGPRFMLTASFCGYYR